MSSVPIDDGARAETSLAGRTALRLRRVTSSAHRYIPEIDGLRFIAIFSVLFFHVVWTATHVSGVSLAPSPLEPLLWPVRYGARGVDLFFVISGFILGLPFAAHYIAGGPRISAGRYYVRRLTRLEPPYVVALLGFYAAAVLLRTPDTANPDFVSGLLLRLVYLHNAVLGVPATLNGVTWSLEVEVQFYLLAPLLATAFALPARWRRWLFVILICGFPFLAEIVPRSRWTLVGSAHYFFMGFLIADMHVTAAGAARLSARAADALGLASLLLVFSIPGGRWFDVVAPWLLAVIFLAALRGGWFRAILRRPWIAVLGGMCYSLYLLHYPILAFVAQHVVRDGMSVPDAGLRVGVLGLPMALAAGILFYIFLERPCMDPNWPRRLWSRATRARRRRRPDEGSAAATERSGAPERDSTEASGKGVDSGTAV